MHVDDPRLTAITAATRQAYDENAAQYARATDKLEYFPGIEEELERFRTMVPSGRVLDLGCGAGRDTRHLISGGRDVVSGDLSSELLKITGREAGTKLVQLDLLALPFRDGAFAGVWASGSLLHVPSTAHPQALNEIYRVLSDGGATAISLRDGEAEGWRLGERMNSKRWFTLRHPDQVAQEMESTGFTSVSWAYCGRRNWFIVEAIKTCGPTHRDEGPAGSA
ncbi:class I SAM-dependent DNA methyltransferase [Lentzea sp. NPDC051213]|uniref:class I SAM-dependent DNA methyltransferase n=1 Tax=Lentzea sp. NPDC051213 TaxID=3364126 RepID=UPI0037B005F1